MRQCSNCRHYHPAKQVGLNHECHAHPPVTHPLCIGVQPATAPGDPPYGKPIIHNIVTWAFTFPDWCCGDWAVRIELAQDLDLEALKRLSRQEGNA